MAAALWKMKLLYLILVTLYYQKFLRENIPHYSIHRRSLKNCSLWHLCQYFLLQSKSNQAIVVLLLPVKLFQISVAAQRANCILSYIKSSVASRSREMIPPLYFALLRPELACCIQLWGPKHNVDLLKWVQMRPLSWPQGYSTSSMKTGWESWWCSAQTEGSRDTLLQLSST